MTKRSGGGRRRPSDDPSDQAKDLSRQVGEWQQAGERTRTQWQESELYLREAGAAIAQLEEQFRTLREAHDQLEARHWEVTARLQEAERQRDEANWYLGELRKVVEVLAHAAAHEGLRRRIELQRGPLVQAQTDVEERRRATDDPQPALAVGQVDPELAAVRTREERRRASRSFRRDLTVELQSPDGAVLFLGQPRDVSPTGVGFVSEHPIAAAAGVLWVRLLLPGMDRPIEAIGRVVWQGPEATQGTVGGCELLDMSPGCREALEHVLANTA